MSSADRFEMEMASQTVNDASQISLGAERGAEDLMRAVTIARSDLGSNSQFFNVYDKTVSETLEKNGTLPMLSLGHAKNSFDKLDLDGSGDVTRDELINARDHSASQVEARMLTMLKSSFYDIRSAHESNKYIPWAEDKKGITLDDLNAKLKEGESRMDLGAANIEKTERGINPYEEHVVSRSVVTERRLPDGEEHVVSTTTVTERKLTEAEVNSRDSGHFSQNGETQRVPDEDAVQSGNFNRLSRHTGGPQRVSDEEAVNSRDVNRLAAPETGTNHTLVDRDLPHLLPEGRTSDKPIYDEQAIDWLHQGKWPSFERLSQEADRQIQMNSCELPEWKVEKGEFLWMIAEQSLVGNGNSTPSAQEVNDMTNLIAQENNMHRNTYLKVGQRLRIPNAQNGRVASR
jgi:hypothetical protein